MFCYFICVFLAFFSTATPNHEIDTIQGAVAVPSNEDLEVFIEYAKYCAHTNGLKIHTVLSYDNKLSFEKKDAAKFLPFALFPSPVPRKLFVQAVKLQEAVHELYFRVSQDHAFLIEMLKPITQSNALVRAWLTILEEVQAEGVHQPTVLLLARADYMFHQLEDEKQNAEDKFELKQIEVNSGNYGGASFGVRMTELHRQIMAIAGRKNSEEFLPKNMSEEHMASGLFEAWKSYDDPKAIILMVSNKMSRWHEFMQIDLLIERMSGNHIKIVYLGLIECAEKLSLTDDFTLRLDNTYTVGVVHFKNLFSTNPRPQIIAARRIIERSRAIKTPSVGQELACSKKIQQVLAMPGMLERFFPKAENAEIVAELRSTFAGMWGMDKINEETQAIIQDAIEHPDNYVMKPSQEGGGNNFWGDEIAQKLQTFSSDERSAHILMQRLKPMVVKNILVHAYENVQFADVVSELSIYGYLLGNANDGKVQQNLSAGYMMRSKLATSNETGVGTSSGVIDSAYLF